MVITTYDLWMTHGLNDTFALAFNYINKKWKPCHAAMAIFEVHETTGCHNFTIKGFAYLM